MRHIKMSRTASKTIQRAMRFYLKKKRYFLLMSSNRVAWNQKSEFLNYIKKGDQRAQAFSLFLDDLVIGSTWKKKKGMAFKPSKKPTQMRRMDSEVLNQKVT